jgi:hypothetical protein
VIAREPTLKITEHCPLPEEVCSTGALARPMIWSPWTFMAKENMVIQAWYPLGHLRAAEMAEIAALNQNKRYYTGIPQMLKSYVEMLLPVYKQK